MGIYRMPTWVRKTEPVTQRSLASNDLKQIEQVVYETSVCLILMFVKIMTANTPNENAKPIWQVNTLFFESMCNLHQKSNLV